MQRFCGVLCVLLALAVPVPLSYAANAQDVLVNSFQNCSGVPCLTIQNVAATGPWTGSMNLNDLFLSSFASCSGVPCLTVNGAGGGGGSGTVTSLATTTPITGGTITTTGTIACPTCGVTGSPLSQFAATTSAQLLATLSNPTGTGAAVFNTSPALVTPTLGVATATSLNKVAITAPATSATLTIADGKTLTVSNTLTLAGTDASTITLGTGGTVAYTANKLSVFASTTSAELAGILSDKVGTAGLSFSGISALANPSASLGLTAVNGSAITAMRSDGAPALDVSIAPTWTGIHTFASTKLKVGGSSSGTVTLAVPAAAGSNTLTLPAGTTDFSATGGTSQVVKQTGAGSALTVARLACADLSDSGAGCTGSGGGAPTDAHYVTTQAESGLSAEVSLGALTTGLLLNTVSASVSTPSAYAGTSCTNQFARSLNASGAATCAAVDLTADVTGVLPVANGGPAWTVMSSAAGFTVDTYIGGGTGITSTTEANVDMATVPMAITCRNMRVGVRTAPGGTGTWDITLRTGARGALAATALTCQITSAALSCSDLTHTAALTAGNAWTIQSHGTNSPASGANTIVAMECYK